MKKWWAILGMELVTIVIVILLFANLDRQIAGLIAGFLFGLLGLVIGFLLLQAKSVRSFTFWWLFVYLGYSVLPMLINRLSSWGVEFADIKIWGMAGPEFHRVSEIIYLVLIFATVGDLIVTYRGSKKIS